MRKIYLLLLVIPFCTLKSQTTQEEFNYMQNGYLETITKGLDIKSGYKVENIFTDNQDGYQFEYKLFEKNDTPVGVICLSKSVYGNFYVVAIPLNKDLTQQYYKSLEKFDCAYKSAYLKSTSLLSAVFLQSLVEVSKKLPKK
ncbi:hypothetical protein [Flavobacterium sp. XGLA_31]|uniref:hypothetical protein n=1 Tax=Flavobacterium sp. XGLA_31 TaxID=3447666 RepID=UPI003F31BE28